MGVSTNAHTLNVSNGFFNFNCVEIKDLTKRNLWDDDMKNQIIANNGSIQNIPTIPKEIRDLYKTVWEIS